MVIGKNYLYVVKAGSNNLTEERRVALFPGYEFKAIWIEVDGPSIMFWVLDAKVGLMWARLLNKKR